MYGGSGKAARELGGLSTASSRRSDRSRPTRRCSCSRASPSASSARTRTRRACSSPTRSSCRHWGDWEHFRQLEALRPHDVRPDDRRLAGSTSARRASCRAPTRPSPRCARKHFGGTLRGRLVLTAGLGGMGGAQPLAVTMNGGVGPRRRGRSASASSAACGCGYVRPRRRRRSTRPSLGRRARRGAASRCRSRSHGNAAEVHPELVRRGVAPRRRHRSDLARTTC